LGETSQRFRDSYVFVVNGVPRPQTTAGAGYWQGATRLKGKLGQRFTWYCDPTSSPNTQNMARGTNAYALDSSVCYAAVHAGVISLAAGGTVTIETRTVPASEGTKQNGLQSLSLGSTSEGFVFVK